jgi:hypothetical protein
VTIAGNTEALRTFGAIQRALGAYVFHFGTERELQDGIASVLAEIGPHREWAIGGDRPDFFIDGVAIEVKVDGSLSSLVRQCYRYAQLDEVVAIVVVTNRHRLARLPAAMNGKPVLVVKVGSL